MGKFFLFFCILAIVILAVFFPIKITADGYYLLRSARVNLSIRLFNKIKMIGGYLSSYRGGFALHFSSAKAVVFGYKDVETREKNFPFRKSFKIKKISLHIRTGAEYFLPICSLEIIRRSIAQINPFLKEKSTVEIALINNDELHVAARMTVITTLYKQLKAIVIYLIRRMRENGK